MIITAIDFETATSKYASACSIGIVTFDESGIKDREYFLIQPPNNFYEASTTKIHGLCETDTLNAPLFPAVWDKIKHYFSNDYVIAHNAIFDMHVLNSVLTYYHIDLPAFDYSDSIVLSNLVTSTKRTLVARCEYFGFELSAHHNALSDAEACARIVIHTYKELNCKSLTELFDDSHKSFLSVPITDSAAFMKFNDVRAKEVAATIDVIDCDDDFLNKEYVFTGELKTMCREEAYKRVLAGGGTVGDGITKRTNVLVNAGLPSSSKAKKALEYQSKGQKIIVVDESTFLRMLESKEAIDDFKEN